MIKTNETEVSEPSTMLNTTKQKWLKDIKIIEEDDSIGFKYQKIKSLNHAIEDYDTGWNECLGELKKEIKLRFNKLITDIHKDNLSKLEHETLACRMNELEWVYNQLCNSSEQKENEFAGHKSDLKLSRSVSGEHNTGEATLTATQCSKKGMSSPVQNPLPISTNNNQIGNDLCGANGDDLGDVPDSKVCVLFKGHSGMHKHKGGGEWEYI